MTLLLWPLLWMLAASVKVSPQSQLPQETTVVVSPKLPAYRLHFIWSKEPGLNLVEKIQVFRASSQEPLQVLDECEMDDPPAKPDNLESWLSTDDLNFDGYPDIEMVQFWGATGNAGNCIWLFDPKTEKFVFSRQFSDAIGRYEVDKAAATITTYSNMSAFIHKKQKYAVRGGKLVLIGDEEQSEAAGKCAYHVVKREEKNGRLAVVGEQWVGADGEPCTP